MGLEIIVLSDINPKKVEYDLTQMWDKNKINKEKLTGTNNTLVIIRE